jgi:putative transposase
MPQSLSRILVHLVFSTKDRAPLLAPDVCERLYPYIDGTLQADDCVPIQLGGAEDHIHLLFGLSRTKSISQVTRDIKSNSTKWMRETFPRLRECSWQAGYGACSVSSDRVPGVVRYIQDQNEHHKELSFKDEFRQFLKEHDIEFDERYVWD